MSPSILFNLHIDLKELKKEIENRLRPIEATKLNDEDINFNDDASKILKLCILEARQQKSETVDSEHILLAIMRQKSNQASLILNEHNVTYEKVLEMLTFQPETPKSGLGFDDEDEEDLLTISSRCGNNGENTRVLTISTGGMCGNNNNSESNCDCNNNDSNTSCGYNSNNERIFLNAEIAPSNNGRSGSFRGCFRRRW